MQDLDVNPFDIISVTNISTVMLTEQKLALVPDLQEYRHWKIQEQQLPLYLDPFESLEELLDSHSVSKETGQPLPQGNQLDLDLTEIPQ